MKGRRAFLAGVCTFVLCASTFAYAKPVGTLTCNTSSGQLKFNISFFTFGVEDTVDVSGTGGGAGAGKVTALPLEVHAALSTYPSLAQPAFTGAAIQSCIINTTGNTPGKNSGSEFEFKDLIITSLTAVASSSAQFGEPAQYTDVKFEYRQVEVKSSSGEDDGGTGGTPVTWNVGQNQVQ